MAVHISDPTTAMSHPDEERYQKSLSSLNEMMRVKTSAECCIYSRRSMEVDSVHFTSLLNAGTGVVRNTSGVLSKKWWHRSASAVPSCFNKTALKLLSWVHEVLFNFNSFIRT